MEMSEKRSGNFLSRRSILVNLGKIEKICLCFHGHGVKYLIRGRKEPMKKSWIGTIVLVSVSMTAGLLLSQIWEQVLGQPGTFSVSTPPQVVVKQPAELPKCYVEFVTVPPFPGENLPRIRLVTVVDTELKKIALYHMDITTGKVWWLSTRNIQPDLMFDQHNATAPLPSELMREHQRLDAEKKENR